MAEKSKEPLPMFTNCKLTICKKVSVKDEELLKFITGPLQFKISGIDPVVFEKDSPSQQDINDLFDTLKSHLEVQEAEDFVIVSDVEGELRKNSANIKLEERETISSSVETLFTRTPVKYIQPTQQVGEKESQDALMSFSDDKIDSFTSSFPQLQVAVGTEDQQQIKTPNTQKNVSCAENISSRCENEKASKFKETNKFEASVYSGPKENNTDFSKTNNKIAVSKMVHDSEKSLQEEKKSDKTATEVQWQVIETESTARNNSGGDSSSNSEILPKSNSETSGNEMEIKSEYTQEVTDVAKGQLYGQMGKDYKINVNQEAKCRMEAEMDIAFFSNSLFRDANTYCVENKKQSVDFIGESPSASEDKSREQTRFVNSYPQKDVQRNRDFKQEESCNKQNVPDISLSKFEQTTQLEDETHKISKCRCNTNEEPTREQGDAGLVTGDVEHTMDKIQKQTEDTVCRMVDQSQSMTGGHSLVENESTTESSLPKTKKDNKIISHGSHNVMRFAGNSNDDKKLSAEVRKYEESFEARVASTRQAEEHDQNEVHDKDQMGKQNLRSERTLNDDSAYKQPLPGNSRLKADEKKSAEREKTETPLSSTRHTSTKHEDSSESDEESQYFIYSLTAPAFKVANVHFWESKFSSYFQDVKEESTGFTFQLDARDKKNVKFINTIKKMRFEEYRVVNEERKSYLESVIEDIESKVNESKLYLVDKKIYIVGTKNIVKSARKELDSRLPSEGARSHNPLGDRNRIDDNATQTSRKTEEKKYDSKRNSITNYREFGGGSVSSDREFRGGSVTNDREFRGREKGESLNLLSMPVIKKVLESRDLKKIAPGGISSPLDPMVNCPICTENKLCFPVQCCHTLMCQDCRQRVTLCPFCRKIWRILTGEQPPSIMKVDMIDEHCPGYKDLKLGKLNTIFLHVCSRRIIQAQECHINLCHIQPIFLPSMKVSMCSCS